VGGASYTSCPSLLAMAWYQWYCCKNEEEAAAENDVDSMMRRDSPKSPSMAKTVPVVSESSPSCPSGSSPPLYAHIKKASVTASLGLQLDAADRTTLYICAMVGLNGPVAAYNATVGEDEQISVGDYIYAVNGIQGSAVKMLSRLQSTLVLDLEVRKPLLWTVVLPREAKQPVGLELSFAKEGRSLVVDKVTEGPCVQWNEENPHLGVQRYDHIISINGVEGETSVLLEVLATPGLVTFGMSRPSGT